MGGLMTTSQVHNIRIPVRPAADKNLLDGMSYEIIVTYIRLFQLPANKSRQRTPHSTKNCTNNDRIEECRLLGCGAV
jgi:hypothetical protein